MNDPGTMIAVVLISTALLILGVVLAVVWGRLDLREPEPRPPATTSGQALRDALRRYAWWANVAAIAAVISGALAATAGGLLVMRIIAMAAPPSAQGLVAGLVAGFLGTFAYTLAPPVASVRLVDGTRPRAVPAGRLRRGVGSAAQQ
jgi:hypothetical protein